MKPFMRLVPIGKEVSLILRMHSTFNMGSKVEVEHVEHELSVLACGSRLYIIVCVCVHRTLKLYCLVRICIPRNIYILQSGI